MRFTLRSFLRDTGFTAFAVLSLAAGVGFAAALASIADAILFRPLPVTKPNEIVRVYTASAGQLMGFVSYPDFEDLRSASRTLSGIVAQSQVLVAAGGEGSTPAQVRMGLAVTPDYFAVLGVPVSLGRGFRTEDAHQPVTVLAHSFWKSKYGGDPRWIGRTILLGGVPFTVIGVASPNFGLDRFLHEDFYVSLGAYQAGFLQSSGRPFENRAMRYLAVYGRLAPGETLERARAELTTLSRRLEEAHVDSNRGRKAIVLTEFQARMKGDRNIPVLAELLTALAVILLVIACANVSGMLLLRGEKRARDIAVRVAMGASQARLLAESLTESLALSGIGGVAGLPVASILSQVFVKFAVLPTDIPLTIAARVDIRVKAVILFAVVLVALVCGLAPWLASRRANTAAVLKAGGSRTSEAHSRTRSVLVVIEIALAAALVAMGGMLLNGLIAAEKLDLGYKVDRVLVMTLDPSQARYSADRTREFYNQLLERVRKVPGVRSVAMAQSTPLGYVGAQRQVAIENQREPLTLWVNTVTPGYFELMHIKMLAGRGFDDHDTASSEGVVIVNGELAKRWDKGSTASVIGERLHMGGQTLEVIGVVRTTKYFRLHEPPQPFLYLPYSQSFRSRMVLHVETEGPPSSSIHAVLTEVQSLDRGLAVSEAGSLKDGFLKGATFGARVGAQLLGAAGACGLMLALAGVYAVVSTSVARRRREIAIRMALGAKRRVVVILIVKQGSRLVGTGTASGLSGALAASRFLANLLEGGSSDRQFCSIAVFAAAALIVAVAGLAACLIPALRASRSDPSIALREG